MTHPVNSQIEMIEKGKEPLIYIKAIQTGDYMALIYIIKIIFFLYEEEAYCGLDRPILSLYIDGTNFGPKMLLRLQNSLEELFFFFF